MKLGHFEDMNDIAEAKREVYGMIDDKIFRKQDGRHWWEDWQLCIKNKKGMKKFIYSVLLLLWCSGLSVNAQSYTLSFNYYSDENGDHATCKGFSIKPTEMVDVVIPETISRDGFIFKVNAISDYAFDEYDKKNILKSITFPQSLETIGECAFRACDSLTFLEIPANVKSIGTDAISYCYHLKKAIIHCSGKFDQSTFYYNHSIFLCVI